MNVLISNGVTYRQFNSKYFVSSDGVVLKNLIITKPDPVVKRYLRVSGNLVHRMVAECWLENPFNLREVHHIDHNPLNNNVTNLEWISRKDHCGEKHKGSTGKYTRTAVHKQRIRECRQGSIMAEEVKSKISSSVKNHFDNPDNLLKYRESLKTRRNGNISPCEIDGIRYESISHASRELGILSGTIRVRLFSKNFPTWLPNV